MALDQVRCLHLDELEVLPQCDPSWTTECLLPNPVINPINRTLIIQTALILAVSKQALLRQLLPWLLQKQRQLNAMVRGRVQSEQREVGNGKMRDL